MSVYRTILIGFGKISALLADDPIHSGAYPYATHAQALRDHPAFQWDWVVDIAADARELAKREWGVAHVAPDIGSIVGAEEIAVAVVATPPDSRPAVLEAFPNLRAVVIEKPLAADVAAAERFLSACHARGVEVLVALPRRYDPTFRELAQGGFEQRFGRPMAAFAIYGNGLANNGTHIVDLIRMILGEVADVQAVAGVPLVAEGPIPGDGNLPFICRLQSGSAVMVNPVRFGAYREIALDIWGERGRVQIVHEGLTVLTAPRSDCRALSGAYEIAHESTISEATDYGRSLFRIYENLETVLQGGTGFCSGEEALATMRVIEAVRRSADLGGAPVRLTGSE